MRSVICGVVVVVACCSVPTDAWGHIFSRFFPENHNNLGYGAGGYNNYQAPTAERLVSPREQLMEALLGEEILEEQLCDGRRCTANEHCCAGHICVDFDGASGACVPPLNQPEGAECRGDPDCAAGLGCDMGACVAMQGKKRYNEPCSISSECDTGRGLCCQVVRRHRQAPKTLCGYFKDPMICFGHVAMDQVQDIVQHTNGEKRLTGKNGDFVNI